MCEYCGCQSIDAIAQLTAEHEELRNLGWEISRAADANGLAAARSLAAAMLAVLGPHTAAEERALFPAMAGEFGPQLAVLTDEHRAIDATLTALADGRAVETTWPTTTRRFVAQLFQHILKEQDGVFPAALATLHPQDWDALAAARTPDTLPTA